MANNDTHYHLPQKRPHDSITHLAVPGATGSSEEQVVKKPRKKRRCGSCQKKLSFVAQTIGKCQCGGVFCRAHSLPSKHHCTFDHQAKNQAILAEKLVQIKGSKLNRI